MTYADLLLAIRLAQAKTGTGKTLAFLLPVIQNILKADPSLEGRWRGDDGPTSSDIRAIIISPTRELAEQIAIEAKRVVRSTGIIVQTAVGGTRKREGLRRIQEDGCHILVGSPGRLIDLFSDENTGVKAPKLSALVLDEADRLLDIGFAPDIARLQQYLPRRQKTDRQTLMFSATVPREVMRMVRQTMKPDFQFVKTVDENEVPTHLAVPQNLVYLNSLENQMPALLELIRHGVAKHKANPEKIRPFKAIVYFNSTAEVSLAQEVYRNLIDFGDRSSGLIPDVPFTEMHSRLTQGQRTKNSNMFRRASSCILFSSDVTARGMDFPDVTHVIQMGVPRDRETYVHRLGRTARANKAGEGWLLVPDIEYGMLRSKLQKLPLQEDTTTLPAAAIDMTKPTQSDPTVSSTLSQVTNAYRLVPVDDKTKTYLAYLGVYGYIGNKTKLVNIMNRVAQYGWGMLQPPKVSERTAQKLGLSRVPGLNIGRSEYPPRALDSGFTRGRGDNFEGDRRRYSFSRDRSPPHRQAPWTQRGRSSNW